MGIYYKSWVGSLCGNECMIEFFTFPKSWDEIKIEINGQKYIKNYLTYKKGIIFGATGFIWQKLSYELSKLGCKLILHGQSIEKLSELDNKIQKIKKSQILVQGDLNNENFYKNLAQSISTRFQKINFLFLAENSGHD